MKQTQHSYPHKLTNLYPFLYKQDPFCIGRRPSRVNFPYDLKYPILQSDAYHFKNMFNDNLHQEDHYPDTSTLFYIIKKWLGIKYRIWISTNKVLTRIAFFRVRLQHIFHGRSTSLSITTGQTLS